MRDTDRNSSSTSGPTSRRPDPSDEVETELRSDSGWVRDENAAPQRDQEPGQKASRSKLPTDAVDSRHPLLSVIVLGYFRSRNAEGNEQEYAEELA